MKKNHQIIVTLLFLVMLSVVLWGTARGCYEKEMTGCFEQLRVYTNQVGKEIKQTYDRDRDYLEGVAGLLEQYDLTDADAVSEVLAVLGGNGMISRLELLLPGDVLLTESGERIDAAGRLSFAEIMGAGAHLSRRCGDLSDDASLILRHFVPVKQHGQTTAVLCGVIELSNLPKLFSAKAYGSEVELYVVEGKTGNFLQDTWHGTLGNTKELGSRETKQGYSWAQFIQNMTEGQENTVVFFSRTAGEYFCAYTAPVGVEDWMVTLNVPERIAFGQAEQMLRFFYGVAAIFLVIFVAYFTWIFWEARREKAIQEKQLRDVRYMLEVEKELFDVHLKPERFQTALQHVADFLSAEVAFFWLIDKHPDIEAYLWSSRLGPVIGENEKRLTVLPGLIAYLGKKGELVSYKMTEFCEELGASGDTLRQNQIHSLMLIPVVGLNGEPAMVLGACNMACFWKTAEPLSQVALSFSMAINHYGSYLELARIGKIDGLTGLRNRHSFHQMMDMLLAEGNQSLTCIFADANGLHELNNQLGHEAGDQMLIAVADALRQAFSGENIYRIGGDEFVVLGQDLSQQDVEQRVKQVRRFLCEQGYEISMGVAWREHDFKDILNEAEEAMQKDKRLFYQNGGHDRRMRELSKRREQLAREKQDVDAFLNVLAPQFKGVYFVSLDQDTLRYLYIPLYFEEVLTEAKGLFSKALLLYAARFVKSEFYHLFEEVCDYSQLKWKLSGGTTPKFVYQKKDGEWLSVRILRYKDYAQGKRETLWIFENMVQPDPGDFYDSTET